MRKLLAIALAAGSAACAPVQHDAAAGAPEGAGMADARPAGAPVSCLTLTDIDHTTVRSDSVIDWVLKNHKVYRNVLPASCPTLKTYERFSYRTTIGRLCSNDVITVFDPVGHAGPTCGLGEFQPVELATRSH